MKKAAAIFHELPERSPYSCPEGASDTLARHILMREDTIADTMAHVKLTVKEQIRQAEDHAAR